MVRINGLDVAMLGLILVCCTFYLLFFVLYQINHLHQRIYKFMFRNQREVLCSQIVRFDGLVGEVLGFNTRLLHFLLFFLFYIKFISWIK
jgi:hypothetical protein